MSVLHDLTPAHLPSFISNHAPSVHSAPATLPSSQLRRHFCPPGHCTGFSIARSALCPANSHPLVLNSSITSSKRTVQSTLSDPLLYVLQNAEILEGLGHLLVSVFTIGLLDERESSSSTGNAPACSSLCPLSPTQCLAQNTHLGMSTEWTREQVNGKHWGLAGALWLPEIVTLIITMQYFRIVLLDLWE